MNYISGCTGEQGGRWPDTPRHRQQRQDRAAVADRVGGDAINWPKSPHSGSQKKPGAGYRTW